jgi:hypothetical protein
MLVTAGLARLLIYRRQEAVHHKGLPQQEYLVPPDLGIFLMTSSSVRASWDSFPQAQMAGLLMAIRTASFFPLSLPAAH